MTEQEEYEDMVNDIVDRIYTPYAEEYCSGNPELTRTQVWQLINSIIQLGEPSTLFLKVK